MSERQQTNNNEPENKTSLFVKDIAKYFMDFLETDFHKRRLPKRSIKFRNENNLLIGVNLHKYPSFNKAVWQLIQKGFNDPGLNIKKDAHKTNLPSNLLDLIKLQVKNISEEQIDLIIESIASEVERLGTFYAKEYDKALIQSIEFSALTIRQEIVLPLIENIEKPILNIGIGDEGDVYIIEQELTSVLSRLLENEISKTLNLRIANQEVNLEKEFKSVFDLKSVENNILGFFENLQIADLFGELFEIERNKNILDKQDLYLYFGDISYRNTKYPIFYIPADINRDRDTINIQFHSQIYINKKALEYIAQEYNHERGAHGSLQKISDRIIYIAQYQKNLILELNDILKEISHFFKLDGNISITSNEPVTALGTNTRISNNCYFVLSDKSDEALINDYEDIIKQINQDEELSGAFNTIIENFIQKNPQSFNQEVEKGWDDSGISEKLVYKSPVPLNKEQLQILSAVRKKGCKYMVVEGPPGTGKSHTITAIIFDSILNNRSVLVLSDKKEALDVVEDKITQTINKVRASSNFQNPILRLGKTGNTYNSILAQSTLNEIKDHYRAVRNNKKNIEDEIIKSENTLREEIEAETLAYQAINMKDLSEYLELELYFKDGGLFLDLDELLNENSPDTEINDLRIALLKIRQSISSKGFENCLKIVKINKKLLNTLATQSNFLRFLGLVIKNIEKIKSINADKLYPIELFTKFNSEDLEKLSEYIKGLEEIKMPLMGYTLKRKRLRQLNTKFQNNLLYTGALEPHKTLSDLKKIEEVYHFTNKISEDIKSDQFSEFDYIAFTHQFIASEGFRNNIQSIQSIQTELDYLKYIFKKYPKTTIKLGIRQDDYSTIESNVALEMSQDEFDKQVRYINLSRKIKHDFSAIPNLNYTKQMNRVENLVTAQATHLLDERVIEFYENNRNDAAKLRDIIRSKQRFPKDKFQKLKQAFPCIIAGIRDYADYIPLEANIFDLVIIDEASQVSIAQAFPALLRAKKTLVLGDKKQFSNIKTSHARSDINREYLNSLNKSFRENMVLGGIESSGIEKFNIKTSILEFFEFINNYHTQLLKHFRGYKEIISYSNKSFYNNALQVMKIRGKQIDQVIKFSKVEPGEEDAVYQNSNKKEVDCVIEELIKIKDEKLNISVGIITPHTNQQKLFIEELSKMPEWDYFQKELKLKIMTFDTCQGEERDTVFYSMVASQYSDKLWAIFIKDLSKIDIEDEGKIKAQRLNVGFSRAKECMHFILSKDIEEYTGSIGAALRHYQYTLKEAKKERSRSETDPKSKMEPEVMNWFYQTNFWKQNKENIEFIPQFELGKYLKQQDKFYNHPEYKVDFLIIYSDKQGREHKIIIEYDGFLEHFQTNIDKVNKFNYQQYQSKEDTYRQRVLESYGNKFLRINKFNAGENPIETLNSRINDLLKDKENIDPLLTNIHETVNNLKNKKAKECLKCKTVKPVISFQDDSLITGYGHFCNECKGKKSSSPISTNIICPQCQSKMIPRNGRYGKFYGCSNFPYCKETHRA